MSQLLDSLKQSDTKNSDQKDAKTPQGTAKVVHPMRSVKAHKASTSWLLPLVIAVLPATSIVAYKYYQQSQVSHEQQAQLPAASKPALAPAISAHEQQVLTAPTAKKKAVIASSEQDVLFLDFPSLVTEPLPVGDSLYSAEPAYQDYKVSEPVASYADNEPSYEPPEVSKSVDKKTDNYQDPYKLENLDLSGLSPELAAQLKSAIVATDGENYQDNELDRSVDEEAAKPVVAEPKSKVIPIGLLPTTVQNKLPKMNFEQHIYSSKPANRWVKVNGQELHEGDDIAPGVKLARIEARDVILKYDGYEISMPALSEW
ncbi:general secretion pathway protein GspB [Photobacterium leiognathi]|uniref:general secretion pathway protein GspB n=1 Tax=Photobacterium leiognathi TaxID=553611 RepID=UPI002736B096|nr:general secretion pathway protein GspB [Photobacterium leiognathi]